MKGKNVTIYVIVCLLAIAIIAWGFLMFYPKNQPTNKLANVQTTPTVPQATNQSQTPSETQTETEAQKYINKVANLVGVDLSSYYDKGGISTEAGPNSYPVLQNKKVLDNFTIYSIFPGKDFTSCLGQNESYCINFIIKNSTKEIVFTNIDNQERAPFGGFTSANNQAAIFSLNVVEGRECDGYDTTINKAYIFKENKVKFMKRVSNRGTCVNCVEDKGGSLSCPDNKYKNSVEIEYLDEEYNKIKETDEIKALFADTK